MTRKFTSLIIVLAMIISVLPIGAVTVSAATNVAGESPTIGYSAIDKWTQGNYTNFKKSADGIYTIPVTGTTANQAFRVGELPIEIESTYIMSVKAKTDGTFTDIRFHNGHSCLEQVSVTSLGASTIDSGWKELKYAITFAKGSGVTTTYGETYCNVASHGLLSIYGGTKSPIIHAGVYFKSEKDCTLQLKEFSFVKVGDISVTPSMNIVEGVGETAEITYTFSDAPASDIVASNIKFLGGTGTVSNITKVSDTVYKVALSDLSFKKEYKITLSGITDREYGAYFPDAEITFSTIGYINDPNVFVYETFDDGVVGEAHPFFTSAVDQQVQLREGSTTDKVVALTTKTNSAVTIPYTIPKAITAADGVVEFSFDYKRVDGHNQNFRYYIANGNVISGQFAVESLGSYPSQGTLGVPKAAEWNTVVLRIDLSRQKYTVTVNDTVTCDSTGVAKEFDFRNPTSSITGVYFNMDATTSPKTILFDNIRVAKANGDYSKIKVYDFEASDSTVFGNFTSIVSKRDDSDVTNGVETGKALELNYPESGQVSHTDNLSTVITSGIAEVSFDIYRSSDAPTIQMYLNSSTGKAIVNTPIAATGNITQHGFTGKLVTIPTNKWVNVIYKMNMYEKTFTVTVDGVEYSTLNGLKFPFRDTTAEDFGKIMLSTYGSATANLTKVQIDNIVVTSDVTNYHMSVSGGGVVVDESARTISKVPIGSTVDEFLSVITPSPAGCIVKIYGADGTEKEGSDKVEKYDILSVIYEEKARVTNFTLIPNYSIDFIGIDANGNEYYEASKILDSGDITLRARLKNYTADAKTFMVYATVVGDKLYDLDLKKNVTVNPAEYADLKFNVTLPDGVDSTNLKLICVDANDGITPLCDAEKTLVYTSQLTRMPNIFSNNMVLQRNEPVNVFGMAPTGTDITVTFNGNTVTGVAEAGRFCVQLPAMQADSTGKTLTVVAGDQTFTYTGVVVGEVLYGSGQSNMQRGVSLANGAVALGQIPNIRAFTSTSLYTTKGRVDGTVTESWKVLDQDTWKNVSGVMYCTAYYLRELGAIPEDVVIGIVTASWGGTSIAMWVTPDILEAGPHASYYKDYLDRKPDSKGVRNSDLYYAMAKSVVPYTAKAAVWYQGEHDSSVATYNWYMDEYVKLMRSDFAKEDLPFYVVQLPGYGETLKNWPWFRITQFESHDPANGVHVVVTNDTGDPTDIHPHDKDIVGERIARHIAYHTYEMEKVPYQGPVFKSASASGNEVTIRFDFVNDGLHGRLCSLASDNSLKTFEVSADGNTWKAASATIVGDTIVVSSNEVSAPAYVRYGYIPTPLKSAGTDSNGVKLPMAPFSEAIN